MTQWLLETFVYTGLLIALVLVLRRPVSRHFGPQIAYALWALPFLRFVMPPIVLPASFAPADPVAQTAGSAGPEPLVIVLAEAPAGGGTAVSPVAIDLFDLALVFWLGGALMLLAWRVREYRTMRAQMLADARPVGETGNIRLVETPAATSPVAFGILDKVVALPPGFMASYDLSARDMAIAHELAHHRGLDLLANVAAQPLLALHWFDPLAWAGWRAMRRDQEAACDARVLAGRERSERAVYAQVIAGFAAGPNLALAAPMACPVLGEKSIIHRLRSLTMPEISPGRRRLGIALVSGAALVLPLTASISYAQPEAREANAAPGEALSTHPLAPPAPPPHSAAPLPPVAPPAPDAPAITRTGQDDAAGPDRVAARNGPSRADAQFEAHFALTEADLDRRNIKAEIEAAKAEARDAVRDSRDAFALARAEMPRVEMRCDGGEAVSEHMLDDGTRVMTICRTAIHAQAMAGLAKARRAIAENRELPAQEREQAIHEVERELNRLQRTRLSHAPVNAVLAARVVRVERSVASTTPVRVHAGTIRLTARIVGAPQQDGRVTCTEQARGNHAIEV